MKTPSDVYRLSPREMSFGQAELEYASGVEVRRVRRDGSVKWASGYVFIGEAMAGELVGRKATEGERCDIDLGPMHVGVLYTRTRTVMPVGAA